jgi:uncharacterized protein YegL
MRWERRNEMPNLENLVEIANPQHPHCPTVLLLDTSGSMAEAGKIAALNQGLMAFKEDVAGDELASKRVDVAVVTFGTDVRVLHAFSSIEDFAPPSLDAGGMTPMGAAITRAMDLVEERKQQYQDKGVDYTRPWIFMITDGEPTDMRPGDETWNAVVGRVHEGEAGRKFMFFAVGVEPARMDVLRQIAPPNRPPVQLKERRFRELFQWLSNSQARVSSSRPGEMVALESPVAAGWGEVAT